MERKERLVIAEREKISASKKEDTIKAVRQAIDDFYENYAQKTEKTVAKTRKMLKSFSQIERILLPGARAGSGLRS